MVTNISHIGIVGGGKMGTSLFNWLSQYNDNLVWIVRSGYERGQKKYKRKLQRSFKNGLISQGDFETRTVKHTITNNLDALQDCDLVIESISENLNAK